MKDAERRLIEGLTKEQADELIRTVNRMTDIINTMDRENRPHLNRFGESQPRW